MIEAMLEVLLASFPAQSKHEPVGLMRLIDGLSVSDQRTVVFSFIKLLTRDFLSSTNITTDDLMWWHADKLIVAAVAKLMVVLLTRSEGRRTHVLSWLCSPTGAGVGDNIAIRRAVITSVSESSSCLEVVFEKSLQQFGDPLYIRHTPSIQQDGMQWVMSNRIALIDD